MTTVTITSSETWTCPSGVTSVDCQCWGESGKAAAGTAGGSHHGGGGGGGGEYAEETTLAVTPGNNYTVTIGTGGTGTATTFPGDDVTVTANAGGSASGATGGAAGTGSSNSIHNNGGAGGNGTSGGSSNTGGGGGGSGGAGGAGGAGSGATAGTAGSGSPAGEAGGAGGAAGGNAGAAGNAPGGAPGGGGAASEGDGAAGAVVAGQVVLIYTAETNITSTGSASLGSMGATGSGAEDFAATGSASLASMGVSGSGAETFAGTGSASLASMGVTASGVVDVTGTGSGSLGSMGAGGSATVADPISATGSADLASMDAGGSGTVANPVSFSGSLALGSMAPLTAMSATGTGTVANPVTATGSASLGSMAVAASGSQSGNTGTGSASLASMGATGSATVDNPAFPSAYEQLDLKVELSAGGTWTDVTSDCDHGPVQIVRGHPDESTTVSPASLAVTLTNSTARYSPDNPSSDLWPWCLQNMPVRVSIPAADNYLRLEPDVGDTPCAYADDADALHITGSLEARWAGRLTDWQGGVFGARVNGDTPAWYWVLNSDGTQTFSWWDSDAAQHTASCDAPLPFITAAFAVKVTLDTSAGTVTFYTASSIDGTYTQLGDAVVSGPTSVAAGDAPLETGTTLSDDYSLGQLCGAVSEIRLYSGIGGTLEADGQFADQDAGTTSWTGTDGLSWVLGSPAEISDRRYRGHFEASEWPQEEPPYNPDSANDGSVEVDALVPLVGAGLLRRLGQRAPLVESPMKRALLAQTGDLACIQLWPCEPDTSSLSQLSSAIAGAPAMTIESGTPVLASDSPFGGATQALAQVNGSEWHGSVPAYSGGSAIVVRFAGDISMSDLDGAGSGSWYVLFRVQTNGSWKYIDMLMESGSEFPFALNITNDDGSEYVFEGDPVSFGFTSALWSIEAQVVSGGDVQWTITGIEPGSSTPASLSGAALPSPLSGTLGQVTDIWINPAVSSYMQDSVLGMISVQSAWEDITSFIPQLNAYTGETAGNRFIRLCSENAIPCRIRGNAADTTAMGTQASDTLANLLQDCANADFGVWTEQRQVLGWGYITRKALYNQDATATVSYLDDRLSPWSTPPTRDDQVVVNDVTVVNDISGQAENLNDDNATGASVRLYAAPGQIIDGGRMSTLSPADGGIGSYAQSYDIVLASDDQLTDAAGWLLHVGTVDEARLPGILIDLANSAATDIYDDVLDLDLGGRLVISDPPPRLGPEDVTQLAQQLTETLWYDTLTIGICGVPERPYEVIADGAGYHLAPSAAVLSGDVGTTATSWTVAADSDDDTQLWTTAAADYPQDWVIDGERVTVTAMSGTSSPQTATVTRSVNGIVKSHTAGAAITNWPVPVVGL